VLAINFVPVPGAEVAVAVSAVVAIVAGVAFTIRQRRARFPLYDLDIAGRRLFWVAAVAGIIVFGSLMAAMFVGQQYLQNVLGYDTLTVRRFCPRRSSWCWQRHCPPGSSACEALG
jgi:hypothetical protein